MRASLEFEVPVPAALVYVIGLGANLGDPWVTLRAAVAEIEELSATSLLARSQLYRSAAMGPPQPDYLNAAVKVRSALPAAWLLQALQHIEYTFGRIRDQRWGPRTLDLDILWSERSIRTADLTVPHLELTNRWWALRPMLDVAPELSGTYETALAKLGPTPEAVAML